MQTLCHAELLGAMRLSVGPVAVDRFRTKKVAELFACLAFNRDRICTREHLANMLWPDEYDDSARMNRLSNALSALRTQMESPTVAKGSVLDANRYTARLRPETVRVDVLDFKQAIKACSKSTDLREKLDYAEEAVKLYRGDFAPTLDSDWIFAERVRLQDAYGLLLADLRDLWEEAEELTLAIDYASRLVETDVYNEGAHAQLIRLYVRAGKNSAAHDQFAILGKVLEELDLTPSPETFALLGSVGGRPQTFRRASFREEAVAFVGPSELDRSSKERANLPSLPFQTTRFFGREEEIALGVQILGRPGARLITLIGPGGSGKTRLSIEIARAASDLFQGCVYFAALADVTDSHLIEESILAGIGVSHQSSISSTAHIAATLENNESSLLVLDNVEQIIEEAGLISKALLDAVPSLKIIATSRRNLNLTGETEVHVSPLPLPLPDTDLSLSEMIAVPSVALFVDRAQHVCADFQLTQRNASSVAELCRRLDGMPLAVELAATWAKTLSPQQMLLQLARRFDFLVTRRRDVPIRHQKMLAIIESSYMQLAPDLRKFFVKLAIFQGGWSLEASEEICEAPLAMPWLQELLERTLITSTPLDTPTGSSMRFDMLETIRAFCESQVESEEREELLLAHANYYAAFAKREGQEVHGYTMKMPIQAFIADLPNYRLALGTAISRSLWVQPALIALHTYQGWEDLGLFNELREFLERIPTVEMDSRTLALIIRQRSRCIAEGDSLEKSVPLKRECLEMFQELEDREGAASVMGNLAQAARVRGDLAGALQIIGDAKSLVKMADNRPMLARLELIQGYILANAGDLDAARMSFREVLELTKHEGHIGAASCNYLAEIEIQAGNYGEAEALSKSALEILKRNPNLRHELLAWLNLGQCAISQELPDLATYYYRTSFELGRRPCPFDWLVAFTGEIAKVSLKRGDHWSALVLTSASNALNSGEESATSAKSLEELSQKLGAVRSQQAIALGRSMRPAEVLRFLDEVLKNFTLIPTGQEI